MKKREKQNKNSIYQGSSLRIECYSLSDKKKKQRKKKNKYTCTYKIIHFSRILLQTTQWAIYIIKYTSTHILLSAGELRLPVFSEQNHITQYNTIQNTDTHTHTVERGWIEAAGLLITTHILHQYTQHNTIQNTDTHAYPWARVNWGCRSSHNRRDATAVPRWWCAPHRLQTSHIEESVINDVIF